MGESDIPQLSPATHHLLSRLILPDFHGLSWCSPTAVSGLCRVMPRFQTHPNAKNSKFSTSWLVVIHLNSIQCWLLQPIVDSHKGGELLLLPLHLPNLPHVNIFKLFRWWSSHILLIQWVNWLIHLWYLPEHWMIWIQWRPPHGKSLGWSHSAWWFQTLTLFSMMHGIILPVDELHHFSRWAHCTTNHSLMLNLC